MPNPDTTTGGNGNKPVVATIRHLRGGDFAASLLESASTLDAAIRKSMFRDERQLFGIIDLARKFVTYGNKQGLDDLTKLCNGLPAVHGYALAQGIMAFTGIPIAEALGVPLSKHGAEILKEYAKRRTNGQEEAQERVQNQQQ